MWRCIPLKTCIICRIVKGRMDYQMTQLVFLCSHGMMVSVQISVVCQMALVSLSASLKGLIASKISITHEISLVNSMSFMGVQQEQESSVYF